MLRALSDKLTKSDEVLSAQLRARLDRYFIDQSLLYYSTDVEKILRIVYPHYEGLKYRIHYEAHDTALSGHLCREKTYGSVRLYYWWPNYINEGANMCVRVKLVNG